MRTGQQAGLEPRAFGCGGYAETGRPCWCGLERVWVRCPGLQRQPLTARRGRHDGDKRLPTHLIVTRARRISRDLLRQRGARRHCHHQQRGSIGKCPDCHDPFPPSDWGRKPGPERSRAAIYQRLHDNIFSILILKSKYSVVASFGCVPLPAARPPTGSADGKRRCTARSATPPLFSGARGFRQKHGLASRGTRPAFGGALSTWVIPQPPSAGCATARAAPASLPA